MYPVILYFNLLSFNPALRAYYLIMFYWLAAPWCSLLWRKTPFVIASFKLLHYQTWRSYSSRNPWTHGLDAHTFTSYYYYLLIVIPVKRNANTTMEVEITEIKF